MTAGPEPLRRQFYTGQPGRILFGMATAKWVRVALGLWILAITIVSPGTWR